MADTLEETKRDESSPVPRISKFDSILFDSDEGPASSLFSEGGMQVICSPFSNDEMIRSPGGFERAMKTPVVCKVVATDAKTSLVDEEMRYKSSVHDKLREQLDKVQADLATERSLRKRKEKSLIKLAKELNSRSTERATKDKEILELSETVEDLEIRLGGHNRAIVIELPRLEARCAKLDAEVAEYSMSTSKLREQLDEARLEVDKAKGNLITHLSKRLSFTDVSFSESDDVFSSPQEVLTKPPLPLVVKRGLGALNIMLILIAAGAALFVGYAAQTHMVSMGDVCAPVCPGSKFFQSEEGIYEAPWWAPEIVKEKAFSALCGDRERMRFALRKGLVTVAKASNGEIVWSGRALGGLSVDSNMINIRNRWGSSQAISAPWSD